MKFYNVSIYTEGQDLIDVPHFDLTVVGEQGVLSGVEKRQLKVKVTYSKLQSQIGYTKFQQQLYQAILDLDARLESWMPTILYRCLEAYALISDIKVSQSEFIGGDNSLHISKQLAQTFKSNDALQSSRYQNGEALKTTFTIKGNEFIISSANFTNWLINLIRQKIVDDDVPYSFGLDIIELRDALITGLPEELNSIAGRHSTFPYLEGKQLLASFCNVVHSTICVMQGKDSRLFDVRQLKFYSLICQLFEIDGEQDYRSNGATDSKKALDRMRKLLKRNSDIQHKRF